jgi:hypothetical protein
MVTGELQPIEEGDSDGSSQEVIDPGKHCGQGDGRPLDQRIRVRILGGRRHQLGP